MELDLVKEATSVPEGEPLCSLTVGKSDVYLLTVALEGRPVPTIPPTGQEVEENNRNRNRIAVLQAWLAATADNDWQFFLIRPVSMMRESLQPTDFVTAAAAQAR